MKTIKINLPSEIKKLIIVPLADIHIGDKNLNKKLLKEAIEYIKNNDNVYTIINGDLCNIALKNSKSDVYNDEMPPMEQLNKLISLLEPIKNKILAITTGNHDSRITKETNIDIVQLVAKQLGIEDRYADSRWYLYVYFGEKKQGSKRPMVYTITGYHGFGSGSSYGGAINKLTKQKQIVIADLYLMSHFHKQIATKDIIYLPDYNNKSLTKKEMYYLLTNSFIEYDNSYAEAMGLVPSSTSIVYAELDGQERKIKVVL